MARSIIAGLIQQGVAAQNIYASAPSTARLQLLQHDFGIGISQDNQAIATNSDILVLAVKPQKMQEVCRALAEALGSETLIVSVAAGITCASLSQWLGGERAIVRCMPNTPSQIGMGATGLFAQSTVSATQKQQAETLLSAVGCVQWLADEALLDAVTAVSGSGPAYFFLLLEAMCEAGIEQGLSADSARSLAIQTARGAAELARRSDQSLSALRENVTSPGGTTAAALASFESQKFRQSVASAMQACAERARELAQELGRAD